MTDKDKILPSTLFPFMWHFLKQHQGAVVIYVLLALAAGCWGPCNSMLIKQVINLLPSATGGNISVLILPASLIVVNFIVFDNITWRGINYIRAKFAPVIMNRIIGALMDHCLAKSHSFYQDHLSGKISKQITNISEGLEILASGVVCHFLRGASLLLIGFIVAFGVNPIFCLILVVWFIFLRASAY